VWVTNNPDVQRLVLTNLFPVWGLKHVATCVWLKVTSTGVPIFPLRSLHRKPFELCYIGMKSGPDDTGVASETSSPTLLSPWQLEAIAPTPSTVPLHVLVSVPTRHSAKPHLDSVLGKYVTDFGSCGKLEVFARSLRRGWCSIGDQVFHHQAVGSCFVRKPS
jgi:N6-adenosine-specific RNA methylase IME4